jgi:hypothetical protein
MLLGTSVSPKSLAELALYKGFPRVKTILQTFMSANRGWRYEESTISGFACKLEATIKGLEKEP